MAVLHDLFVMKKRSPAAGKRFDMMRSNFQSWCFTTALICSVLTGCGSAQDKWTKDRPQVFKATGILTLDGQPIDDANINLIADNDRPGAYGITDVEGKFTLTTFTQDDGAPEGQYIVTARKKLIETKPSANPELNPPKVIRETYIIPEKFGDREKSGLTATIAKTGPNHIQLDLKSSK